MKHLFLLFIILIFSNILFSQQKFVSDKYNFSITFPKKWDVETKNNDYIVEAKEDEFTSVIIRAVKLNSPDTFSIRDIEIREMYKLVDQQLKSCFNKYEILKYDEGMLDSIPAYFFFTRYADNLEDFNTTYISFQYQVIYKKYLYSIFAISTEKDYIKHENTFNKIYSSFKFLKKLK